MPSRTAAPAPTPSASARPPWAAGAALIAAATVLAYLPALRGGFLWDDDAHVTRPELRSWHGLARIWFDLGATQQYYPLLHSSFWLQHKLWGDSPVGYHVVNIALHVLAAVLVLVTLRTLLHGRGVAWADHAAFLSAALFALHPVHVESVAWITELKNTQSGLLYLAALLAYLDFDRTRRPGPYALATACFVLALLSKTVTATLPGALLVILWWQRGRLGFNRDVLPLIPWFLLGTAAGLLTAWVEVRFIGAHGRPFELSALQRFLLSGRVVWFYLYQLAWPVDLNFIYPRWRIEAADWRQGLYPAGALLLLAILVRRASRHRAPLAALLFFVGTLFPVLGFFNVYPFVYSFVACHFQYLASLGILALVGGAIAAALTRIPSPPARGALLLLLPAILGVLTFRECRVYADRQTLYETTLARNPACWMACINLGVLYKEQNRLDGAIAQYRRALTIQPDASEAFNNLGVALHELGRNDEAIDAYRSSLQLRSADPEALGNLGVAMADSGRFDEAIEIIQRALRLDPQRPGLHVNLGVTLQKAGRPADAADAYRRALSLDPNQPRVQSQLNLATAGLLPPEQALAAYERILRDDPDHAATHFAAAVLCADAGRIDDAIAHYQAALRVEPNHFEARSNLAALLARSGQLAEAIPHFEQAARLRPGIVESQMNLAVAYSSSGRFTDALACADRALQIARSVGQSANAEQITAWMEKCRARAAAASAPASHP